MVLSDNLIYFITIYYFNYYQYGVPWCVWYMISIYIFTHLGTNTYDVVHWGKVLPL